MDFSKTSEETLTPLRASSLAAVFLCGTLAFLELYCVQPMLPMLSQVFGVTEAHVGITISASTVGVALSAILLALFGESLKRKPAILFGMTALAACGVLMTTAQSLHALALWRFAQGLATPFVFIVTIAYITEEWPALQVPRVMSVYVAGTVFGGFCGRLLGGLIAEHFGWHAVFACLGVLGLAGALLAARMLPPARFRAPVAAKDASVLTPLIANMKNMRLVATFTIGFCMLFTLVATFSFITFQLSDAPFHLSLSQLSWLFAVYIFGLFATVGMGGVLVRIGLRAGMLIAIACGLVGIALTLAPSLVAVAVGLAVASSGVFIAQTCANSFLRDAAPAGARVSATGMYICCYYIGGTVGGMLPGVAWRLGRWPACVALIAAMLVVAGVTAWFGWKHRPTQYDPVPV